MEHIGDTAWFPGAVVTHNEACNVVLIRSSRLMSSWLWGSHMLDPYSRGGGGSD